MQLLFPILVILSSSKILNVFGKCRPSTYSVSGFHLSGHEMSTMIVSNLSECVTACVTKICCKSLNFRLNDKSCHLNNAGRHAHPEDYGPKQDLSTWMCLNHPRFVFSTIIFPMLVRSTIKFEYNPRCHWLRERALSEYRT